jgi:hypothetical protein
MVSLLEQSRVEDGGKRLDGGLACPERLTKPIQDLAMPSLFKYILSL